MGMDVDAVLAYGFNLGSEQSGWNFFEVEDPEKWPPPWLEEGRTFPSAAEYRVLDIAPELDITVEQHSGTKWMMTAFRFTVPLGKLDNPNLERLTSRRISEGWDDRLWRAANILGITPKEGPDWILTSYYDV